MVQLLKGKGKGARALLAWLKLLLLKEVGLGGRQPQAPQHEGVAQVLSTLGSPGQLHLAPFSNGSEDNIHSGTQDQWFQGGWKDNGMMLWGLVWLEYGRHRCNAEQIRRAGSCSSRNAAGLGGRDGRVLLQLATWSLNGFQSPLAHRLQRRLCWPAECHSMWWSHHGSRTAEGYCPQYCCHQ